MRVLGPVVQALVPAVLDPGHQLLLRRRIARQLVGDHDPRRPALLLEQLAQQALGRFLVAPALDEHVERDPVLVDGPPQPVLHAGPVAGSPPPRKPSHADLPVPSALFLPYPSYSASSGRARDKTHRKYRS